MYTSTSSLGNGNYTIDGKTIINDVYVNLSNIYNLIGKFRSNYKMIIFDAINDEQHELLDNNIILCKLNAYNIWSEMIPEMKKYIGEFEK